MANHCYYSMKVVGKKSDLEDFLDIMQYKNGDEGPFLYRVFDAELYNDDTLEYGYMEIQGNCAWSVHTCMLEGPYTYFDGARKNGRSCNGTSLLKESKRLNLKIEVFSEEPNIGFEEYFLIEDGSLIKDQERDLDGACLEEFQTLEEFNEKYGTTFTESDFNDEGYVDIGGFDWIFSI